VSLFHTNQGGKDHVANQKSSSATTSAPCHPVPSDDESCDSHALSRYREARRKPTFSLKTFFNAHLHLSLFPVPTGNACRNVADKAASSCEGPAHQIQCFAGAYYYNDTTMETYVCSAHSMTSSNPNDPPAPGKVDTLGCGAVSIPAAFKSGTFTLDFDVTQSSNPPPPPPSGIYRSYWPTIVWIARTDNKGVTFCVNFLTNAFPKKCLQWP
jgi:hypothetical protein